MPLTDTFLKTLKYSRTDGKPQRERDTQGLYIEVTPKGVKKWQMKYKRPVSGKESRLSFGQYPDISLKEARQKRDDAREQIRNGIDPADHKREAQRQAKIKADNGFEMVAREWWTFSSNKWTEKHAQQVITSLEQYIFPFLGGKAINAIQQNGLTAFALGGYSGVLSQNYSVTPQRHCGIFMPVIRQNGGIAPLWWDDTAKYNTLYGEHAGRFCNTESESRRPNASQALAAYSTKLQALQK